MSSYTSNSPGILNAKGRPSFANSYDYQASTSGFIAVPNFTYPANSLSALINANAASLPYTEPDNFIGESGIAPANLFALSGQSTQL
eukprot:2448816-Ditylum_brightwellii.AAC.1